MKHRKARFLLDIANATATVWVVVVPIKAAAARLSNQPNYPKMWLFIPASLFVVMHKYFLREVPGSPRWIRKDRERKQTIFNAINQITRCIEADRYTTLSLWVTENYILRAMLSHVESTLEDPHGIYINVNLLVEDPIDPRYLWVINRAKPERGLDILYPKDGFLAWEAMRNPNESIYEPDFKLEGKPYRSILLLPIASQGSGDALGVVSIDSEKKRSFWPLCERIIRFTSPPFGKS